MGSYKDEETLSDLWPAVYIPPEQNECCCFEEIGFTDLISNCCYYKVVIQ